MGFGFGLFGKFVVKDVLLHDGAADAREGFRREALELFLVDLFLDADILPHPGIAERGEHALERPFLERLELRGRPEAHDPELELYGLLFAEQFRLARFGETPDRKLKGGDFKPDRFRLGCGAGLDLVDLFGNAEADEVDLALAGRNLGKGGVDVLQRMDGKRGGGKVRLNALRHGVLL